MSTMFSQLKSLAKDIENGLEHFQKEIVDASSSTRSSERNHSAAVNEMRHKWKDARDMKLNVEKMKGDFELRSDSFTQVCSLFEQVLNSLPSRLGNVEDYLEKYGYQKPPPRFTPSSTSQATQGSAIAEDSHLAQDSETDAKNGDDPEEENIEEGKKMNRPADETSDCNASTFSKKEEQKPVFPKLEDFYNQLSEETIVLFKQGSKAEKSVLEAAPSVGSFVENMPKPPKLRSDSHSLQFPKPPVLLTQDFNNSSFLNRKCENQSGPVTKDYDVPPRPELLTQMSVCSGNGSALSSLSSQYEGEHVNKASLRETSLSLSTMSSSNQGSKAESSVVQPAPNGRNFVENMPKPPKLRSDIHSLSFPEPPVLLTQDFSNSSFLKRKCENVSMIKDYDVPPKPELLTQKSISCGDENAMNSLSCSQDEIEGANKASLREASLSLSTVSPPNQVQGSKTERSVLQPAPNGQSFVENMPKPPKLRSDIHSLSFPEPPVLLTQDLSNSSFFNRNLCENVPPVIKTILDCDVPPRPELLTQKGNSGQDENVPSSLTSQNEGEPAIKAPPRKASLSLSSVSPPKPPRLLGSYAFYKK